MLDTVIVTVQLMIIVEAASYANGIDLIINHLMYVDDVVFMSLSASGS